MFLYLNCYVIGEGYTLKRTDFPEFQELTMIRRRDMLDCESAIFTGAAAPYLFLGTVENRRFGCVRDIETALKDENGRRCFIHVALEAEKQEADLVDAVLLFALRYRDRFIRLCNRIVINQSGDYLLDTEAFCTMMEAAKKEFTDAVPAGILIPQTSADDFFANAGRACKREEFSVPFTYEEWKRQGMSMDLFLYCSTPSSGFVLSQIDTLSGEKLRTGKEANVCMLPWAQSILTCSGAVIALFEQDGKICFVGRDIQSASTDQYGRRKKMSLVLQASAAQSLPVRQVAAWALVDFASFSEQLTECVKIYDGPRGYEVQGNKLAQMLDQVSRQIYIPKSNTCCTLWEQASAPPDGRLFLCLVCEATLNYFCRSCNINILEQDVRLMLNIDDLQGIREKPANLVFTPELYTAPTLGETESSMPIESKRTMAEPSSTEQTAVKVGNSVPMVQPSPETKAASPIVKRVESSPQQEAVQLVDHMDRPLRGNPDFSDEERIDLLQQKWFWPVIGLLALAIIGGVTLWFRFRG